MWKINDQLNIYQPENNAWAKYISCHIVYIHSYKLYYQKYFKPFGFYVAVLNKAVNMKTFLIINDKSSPRKN